MIKLNTPYRFGIKTFWLNLLEQGSAAMFLFLILIGVSISISIGSEKVFRTFGLAPSQYVLIDNFMSLIALFIIVLFILSALYAWIFSFLFYKNYTFILGDHALEIKKGILSRQEISIPYRQIQDVDVSQSLLQRIIGVCRLVVLTAGQEDMNHENRDHSEAEFILIDRTLAEELHAELIERSNVQEIKEYKDIPTETS